MTRQYILIFVLLILLMPLAAEISYQDIFREGATHYSERNYEEALTSFLSIAEEGIENAELYYNIGNTYFRLHQLGNAILYYKKGLRIRPDDNLLIHNLNYALTHTKDRQQVEETNPLVTLIRQVIYSVPINSLLKILLASFFLVFIAINVIIISFRERERTVPLFILSIFLLLLLIVSSISYYRWSRYTDNREAVLLSSAANGFSGPDDDYTNLFRIHEGMIFKVVNRGYEWSQIELPTGISGWIRNETFALVNP